jgi:hypothetical protein
MSKRQLASAYRGYHGLEPQYHALMQMSNTSLLNTKIKNDHLHLKHVEEIKHLIEQEKSTKEKAEKDIKVLREDFTAQLAYQYVYKNQSFKRHYKSQQQKKPRPVSDKPEFYEMERRKSAKAVDVRPLGSLRQIEIYKDELKVKFPPLSKQDSSKDGMSPRVNMMGETSYLERTSDTKDNNHETKIATSFPNIEDAMGIHVKFEYKKSDDDRLSTITAPPAGLDAESDNDESVTKKNLVSFNMGQNLLLMRQKEKENFEKRRKLPTTPNSKTQKLSDGKKDGWRRVLPETPSRPSSVYLGSKNDIQLRKLMKKEATDVMNTWNNISMRKEVNELAKEHNKSALAKNPVPVFDISRPTSAILRDFQQYKRKKEDEIEMREQEENQTMIVRQLSPQPRVGSPVATSRNRYMHSTRPSTSHGGTSTLHRTDSEKFPSVSRTSSYKEVPEADRCLENALLTAAERIELERKKRSNEDIVEDDAKVNISQKIKRRLPITPNIASKKIERPTTSEGRVKAGPVKVFDTSALSQDRDMDMINRVRIANKTRKEGLKPLLLETKPSVEQNNEDNSYKPLDKQDNIKSDNDGMTPSIAESLSKIKSSHNVSEHHWWPKSSKAMKFNYDNYSRTTPKMKKRMETRAKNRKKIQQKNAEIELLTKQAGKEALTREDVERPSTRVSFNENVIVFQTI